MSLRLLAQVIATGVAEDEAVNSPVKLPHPRAVGRSHHVYHSRHNPGASHVVQKLSNIIAAQRGSHVLLSTNDPNEAADCACSLLYLDDSTFTHGDGNSSATGNGASLGALLCEELAQLPLHTPLLLVHDGSVVHFDDIILGCPETLRETLFATQLSIPLYDGYHQPTSLRMILFKLEQQVLRRTPQQRVQAWPFRRLNPKRESSAPSAREVGAMLEANAHRIAGVKALPRRSRIATLRIVAFGTRTSPRMPSPVPKPSAARRMGAASALNADAIPSVQSIDLSDLETSISSLKTPSSRKGSDVPTALPTFEQLKHPVKGKRFIGEAFGFFSNSSRRTSTATSAQTAKSLHGSLPGSSSPRSESGLSVARFLSWRPFTQTQAESIRREKRPIPPAMRPRLVAGPSPPLSTLRETFNQDSTPSGDGGSQMVSGRPKSISAASSDSVFSASDSVLLVAPLTNGDLVDSNGDGLMDSRLVDTTGDGVPDSLERLRTRRPESDKIGGRESSRVKGNGAQVAL